MNPFQVSKDNNISRIIDGAVLLVIGMIIGIISAQFVAFYEAETVTTTKVIKRVPVQSQDNQGTVNAPQDTIWFDQI